MPIGAARRYRDPFVPDKQISRVTRRWLAPVNIMEQTALIYCSSARSPGAERAKTCLDPFSSSGLFSAALSDLFRQQHLLAFNCNTNSSLSHSTPVLWRLCRVSASDSLFSRMWPSAARRTAQLGSELSKGPKEQLLSTPSSQAKSSIPWSCGRRSRLLYDMAPNNC